MNLLHKIKGCLPLFVFFSLLVGLNAHGQVLKQPEILFTHPCASSDFNQYYVEFSWDPPLVNTDNQFILELSNPDGSFQNPTVLASYSNMNTTFKFQFEFGFPENTYGTNYKVRVRSTSPEEVSPESLTFPAYFLGIDEALILNNYEGTISLCGNTMAHIEVTNFPNEQGYRWYRNGTFLPSESNYFMDTDVPGIYYVELDYGTSCSSATLSNAIEVKTGDMLGVQILGSEFVELCSNQTTSYYLEVNIDDSTLQYQWFKDDSAVTDLGYYPTFDINSVTTPEGIWKVVVTQPSGCQESSNSIQVTHTSIDLLVSASSELLLPNETVVLTLTTNASSPSIKWFKNDIEISNENQSVLYVSEPGNYYATVIDQTICDSEITSNNVIINAPVSFQIFADYDGDYSECSSVYTQIGVSEILATLNTGSEVNVTNDVIDQFTFQWLKDDVILSNASSPFLTINSADSNGTYKVEAQLDGFHANSNELDVKLAFADEVLIYSEGQFSCDGSSFVEIFTELTGSQYVYNWYWNGTLMNGESESNLTVSESGVYQLKVNAFGCEVESNTITVNPVDQSVVEIDAPEVVSIPEGTVRSIFASGGDYYEWYLADTMELLSQSFSLDVSQEGNYILIAYVNGCEVVKTFSVIFTEDTTIPNVITLNSDGINDQWILPSSYANKDNVRIVVQTERGDILLNTNNYQNTWPNDLVGLKTSKPIFYYKIIKDGDIVKRGTITIIF